jgi:hypothetical protein
VRDRSLLAAAVAALTLAACSGGAGPSGEPTSDAAPQTPSAATAAGDVDGVDGERLVAALCDAAAADTVEAADRRFMSGAHGPLHDLARAVVEVDRQVAARLHEAKQAAEAALAAGEQHDVERRLAELTEATRTSLEALDQPAPGCDDRNAG